MIHTSRRAAEERDLRVLAAPGDSIALNLLRGALPLSLIAFGLTYLVSRSVIAAGVVALGLFSASFVSNLRFFRDVSRRAAQKADAGAVEVFEVEATRVLDIEPVGDNAPAYVFFSNDGKALFLVGQWLIEQSAFPALSFTVFRWSDTGRPIRIETRTPEIDPEQSTVHVPPDADVPDIALIDAAPETLQKDLDRAFRPLGS